MSTFIDTPEFRNLLYSWPEKILAYLYEDYYELLLKIAEMHTHDGATAEDAVQEVFNDIAERHKELGRSYDEPFHKYLIRAVSNHAITLYWKNMRSNIRDTRYYYTTQTTRSAEKNAEEKIIAAEKRSFLKVVVETIPPREKACFLMKNEQNLKVKEIARRLGISAKSVESNITRARRRLKKYGSNLN